jgi:MtaA/CmuA family methyltransferase
MLDFYDDPPFVAALFGFVVELALQFGKAQVEAGADVVGIGDPAASLVRPRIYDDFVWAYEKKLVDGLHAMGARVRLHICGDTRRILGSIAKLGCEIVDIDSRVAVSEARAVMGDRQVLLGGIDPVRILQYGRPEDVEDAVSEVHRQAGNAFIVGAGCEVPPGTPPENLRQLHRYACSHV